MENAALLTSLLAIMSGTFGWFVSWSEQRFGNFEGLKPGWKQTINGVLSLVISIPVVWLSPYWSPSFGNLEEVLYAAAHLVIPMFVWLITQVAHYFDPNKNEKDEG